MCAWRPMNEQDYFATNHALQTALIGKLRTRGDLTLDAVGIQRRVGPVEMSTSSHHTGRYDIRYSVALAAIRGLTELFQRYGFYEVEVWIRLLSVDGGNPDGDIHVVRGDDPDEVS
ncbi:MAG: hypothetical protein LQ348_005713 [Seirophora lacunosa]|nr:MAG: hypothetical protein LQ348_005713 [Seirophora lacunosa]